MFSHRRCISLCTCATRTAVCVLVHRKTNPVESGNPHHHPHRGCNVIEGKRNCIMKDHRQFLSLFSIYTKQQKIIWSLKIKQHESNSWQRNRLVMSRTIERIIKWDQMMRGKSDGTLKTFADHFLPNFYAIYWLWQP